MSLRFSNDSTPFPHSITATISGNYSLMSSGTEMEPHTTRLPSIFPYRDEISKFKEVKKNDNFDIKPSWSGMNIQTTTKDQLDMQILSKRVNFIMESAILHAHIMASLPKLLENNGALLRKWMKHEDAQFVISRLTKISATTSGRQIKTITGFMVDNELQLAFRMLTTNKCLPLYIDKYPPEMSQYIRVFINALTEFSLLVRKQMEMTACEVVEKDKYLRRVYEELRERRIDMKRYADSMQENINEHDVKMQKKEVQIARVREKIRLTNEYYEELMQTCLRNSDKTLFQAGEQSLAAQAELADEAKQAQINYANLRDNHLNEERMLRTRKTKLEAQLAMWLSKYDMDVGDRQSELDEVADAYEKESGEMQELECLILEQEKIFTRYKAEKEEEDLEEIKEKLFVIASERAAKIIQRAWRDYLRRKKRRKGKGKKVTKGKKKKK